MKNMIGEGFIENLKPAIKLHQNENVLKMLELAKDKPDSCLELLSVAIFHHNVPIIKNILEKFDIKESDSPFINAFSFYNSILPDDSKDKLTDSKESYMDVQIHFILMAGISGHIDIFETFMNKNLIINKKLTGVIGLSKKHKNVFTSNVIGACAYYGKSQLLDFILKNYKDEIDINIVTTEKKSKNSKLGFSKEFTGCTPPLLAVVGPSSDKDTLQILKILKNYGAKFTAIDCNKNNILHLATKDNKIETAKYICDELGLKNLNNENNKDGYTPLSLAQHMNNEIFITYFCNINEDDEKKIEENWKELLEDSKKRDAKLNKKKKKKKGKNTDDDMPMLLNSTEYQETLKSEIKKEEPEKEEDIIIGLKIKKNKKNKKNKMTEPIKKEVKANNEINIETSEIKEEPKKEEIKEIKSEIKEEPKKEKKVKTKKIKKEKRSDKEATDEFLEKMRKREKERQEMKKLEEEKKKKEQEEKEKEEQKKLEEQKKIEEELKKKELEEKERQEKERIEREKEEELKKQEEQKLLEEEEEKSEKESITSNDENNINNNNISENNKEIENENAKEIEISAEDYEKLNKKYLDLEKKLSRLEQEKTELTSCLTKLYLENKSDNGKNQIPNNEENINDLMYLANKELESKNEIINELENKLAMLDLTNIKNFSVEKLKTYKEFYDKNLKIINDAMK